MGKCGWATISVAVFLWMIPTVSYAQGVAENIKGLQSVLDILYDEMMPMCSKLIGVGRGIAGFAAIFYIANRIWRHIANAEPIDFYPLFRPFVLCFCIIIFPSVIGLINGVLKPTVTGTLAMVEGSDKAIAELLKQKEKAVKDSKFYQMYVGDMGSGDKEKWLKYTQGIGDEQAAPSEGFLDGLASDIEFSLAKMSYNFRNSVKQWMSEILQILFQAAALCINTLRTFQLIVLAILGPLVLGIAVFDGFQHSLTAWVARYINVFLWLPVANIFGAIIGKIQENMLKLDLSQIEQGGDTFFSSTDAGYLIFMLIGILGYTTVPSVASFIINSGDGGALGKKVTNMASSVTGGAVSGTQATGSALMSNKDSINQGYSGSESERSYSDTNGQGMGSNGSNLSDRLAGGNKKGK